MTFPDLLQLQFCHYHYFPLQNPSIPQAQRVQFGAGRINKQNDSHH